MNVSLTKPRSKLAGECSSNNGISAIPSYLVLSAVQKVSHSLNASPSDWANNFSLNEKEWSG